MIQKGNNTHCTLEITSECYSRTNDASKIEDSPEDTDIHALLSLSGVRHHQRTLSGPKKSCTDAKDGTGCDNECTRARMDVNNTEGDDLRNSNDQKRHLTGMKQYITSNPKCQASVSAEAQGRC
jgi:hypothetical protein